MRRTAQVIAALAFVVSVVWFLRHPLWESGISGITTLAFFVGLLVEQKLHNDTVSDRRLFGKFKKVLPSTGSIAFIDKLNVDGSSFNPANLEDLDNFTTTWNNAEHEFIDKKLEKRRKRLLKLIKEYRLLVGGNTFRNHNGTQTVPPEWEDEQPDRFNKTVELLHNKAGEVVDAHQQLIRAGRKKLEVWQR